MDFGTLATTAVGILITIALAVVAHRRSIGVRDERIRRANAEVVNTLVKRVVSDNYSPTSNEIRALLLARAFDNRVAADLLLGVQDTWMVLIGKAIEHDFVTSEERIEILKRLNSAREAERPDGVSAWTAAVRASLQERYQGDRERVSQMVLATSMFAVLAAVAGSVAALLFGGLGDPPVDPGAIEIVSILAATLGAAIATIGLLEVRRRMFRESGQPRARSSGSEVEREVRLRLEALGASVVDHAVVDFEVEYAGKRIPVEIKAFAHRPAAGVLQKAAERLIQAVEQGSAEAGLLIVDTRHDVVPPESIAKSDRVHVVRLEQLESQFPRLVA